MEPCVHNRQKNIGVVAILVASLLWAVEAIFVKLAGEHSPIQSEFSSALHTSAVRAVVVLAIAFLYMRITHRRSVKVSRSQFSVLTYIALGGTVFADLMYFYALTLRADDGVHTLVPVANAVLIGHMQPVFIVLFGFLVLKEDRLTRHDFVGIGVMIVAMLLATTKTLDGLVNLRIGTIGDLYVLFATIAWATTGMAMRKYLRSMNAGVITFYRYTVAATVLVVWTLLRSGFVMPDVYQVLIGLVVGVGTLLYYESLKRLKAAQTSALELSTPFFAAFLGYLVLSETVTVMQGAGIVLLFLGVYFLSKREGACS